MVLVCEVEAQQPPSAAAVPAATDVPASAAPGAAKDTWKPSDGQTTHATGYLLPAGETELGIFYMGHGITDWLSVGTQPAPWVVAPILGGISINLSVKAGIPLGDLFNVALEFNPIWLRIKTEDTHTEGWLLPLTLSGSFHPTHSQSYSLAVRYVSAEGVNDSTVDSQEVGGSALTRLVQLLAQAQFQLTGAVAIYGIFYLQPWTQKLSVQGQAQVDQATTVQVDGQTSASSDALPWAAMAGAHFRFGVVNIRVGGGYGNFFIPRIGETSRLYKGFVPDFDFFVRF